MKNILVLLTIIAIFTGCANIMAPTGGPKDETPPVLKKSNPEQYALNFTKKDIELTFDEYVKLDNLQKKLIVSPPVDKKPHVLNYGKSLKISFDEELRENTTYTINFGNAIVDNNENNPIPQFEFVFSTGDDIDSLSISGEVYDAFLNKPIADVYAMLYDNLNDSAPLLQVPYYVSKTDKDGRFTINNVKLDTFKLFILNDLNMSYKYDSPDELVGFSGSLVIFKYQKVELDSVENDSIIQEDKYKYLADNFRVYLFKEENTNQYLKDSDRPQREKISFVFNRPLFDSANIQLLYQDIKNEWYIKEEFKKNNRVDYWITHKSLIKSDTLSVAITYSILDSSEVIIPQIDTILFRFRDNTQQKNPKRNKNELEIPIEDETEYLNALLSVSNGIMELNTNPILTFNSPIFEIDTNKIHLYQIIDSIEYNVEYQIKKDDFLLRNYYISHKWQEGANYRLFIEPHAFTDIYNLYNDTINNPFTLRNLDYYGNLLLNLTGINENVIVQLMTKDDVVIQEKYTNSNTILTFSYITPGNYKLKLIFDRNNNKKWDTGKYLHHVQPENTLFYPDEINIRANWDVEQTWELIQPDSLNEY